jgi:O-antigen/teichoic acid export membrane protein
MPTFFRNVKLSLITFFSRLISGSVIYIVLARVMTIEEFGLLSFGVTFAALLIVVAEFGFSLMAQRDIPQKRFGLNEYVYNALIQKSAFSLLSVSAGIIYLFWFYSGITVTVGVIFVINAIVSANSMFLFAVFRSVNIYRVESILSGLYAFFMCVIVVIYFFFDPGIIFLSYGLLLSRFIQLIALVIFYIVKFGFPRKLFNKEIHKYFFRNSFSFGAHYIIGVFYFTVDSQLLFYFAGADQLAIYQAIFRIVLVLLSFGDLLNNIYVPFLSSRFFTDKVSFIQAAKISNKTIFTLGLGMLVFFYIFSKDIMQILYSDKFDTALAIVLPLSAVLFLRISTSLHAVLLTISDYQRIRVIVVFISLLMNVFLNLWLIPLYGFTGAAYVSMITHLAMAAMYLAFSKLYIKFPLYDREMMILLLVTTGILAVFQIFQDEYNIAFSIFLIMVWLTAVLLTYSRHFFLKQKELFLGQFY